jgi:heme a synthase
MLKRIFKKPLFQLYRHNTTTTTTTFKKESTPKSVKYWLLGCSSLVVSIVVIGGLTRLEEGGLSMVDWKPLGSLPPMNPQEWLDEFERYKQYPEFKKKNSTMKVDEFKYIYYYEYVHRMVGRLIGITFILPSIYFYSKGYFNSMLKRRIPLIGLLIGCQGLMGWYMVKSGLDENHRLMKDYNSVPRVSQYRLASHLSLAIVIYSSMVWTWMDLHSNKGVTYAMSTKGNNQKILQLLKRCLPWTTLLVFTTMVSGAFVAGMDAGLIYDEFPLMGGKIIPRGLFTLKPFYLNFFENATTVQFDHRTLAEITGCCILFLFFLSKRHSMLPKPLKIGFNLVFGITCLQITLGITTLLQHVPTKIAASHQLGSLTLLTNLLWLTHFLKKRI